MNIHLPTAVTTRAARSLLVAQKNSPKLLFGTGIVLMGATVVSACKATLNLEGTLDDIRRERENVAEVAERRPDEYTEHDVRKLNIYITGKGLLSITRLYLPSIALGVAAVGCLTTSHNQLTRRNAGLSAALAATERALDRYRDRVREAYGEETEKSLWRGEREGTEPILDDQGRETKSVKKVKEGGGHSPYARIWGRDTSNEWSPQSAYNLAKLTAVQEWGTMQINSRGHLFLNEILDQLGLDRMPAGAVVGWKSKKYGGKNGYVDFGITKPGEELRFVDFLTGDEEHILLDFNVDGEIWREI
jgi:hypothetical protein